ncbi:hypothetical protein N7474_002893 [Penicillium riverlandense]|uniref:uncharacterized protein n=1 Tax=Penicillium riverlandense TaxID=1903569 RepID=UPI0025482035|nr:uncharacterized protein N7474_002893 [Penicillium riverlandense]KAJ5825755.1 hypothetical protein N7474_002893 [Penicillium riverlandense]
MLKAYPLLCDSAREVTVIFHPEPGHVNGPLIVTGDNAPPLIKQPKLLILIGLIVCIVGPAFALAKLASWVHRSAPFQKRHVDLRDLVNTITFGFRSRKSLKIVLYLEDLCLQDLKIILDLFEAPFGSISLEERWIQRQHPLFGHRVMEQYEIDYKKTVDAATQESGHMLLSTICPSLEEYEVYETEFVDKRGCEMIGKRRRVWLD